MPVNIVSIIEEEVGNLSTDPVFSHGTKSFNNYKADRISTENGVVFLYEPISYNSTHNIGGSLTQVFNLLMFFGGKVPADQLLDFEKHREVLTAQAAVATEFQNRMRAREDVDFIGPVNTLETFNEFDKNITGVAISFPVTCTSADSICVDEIIVPPPSGDNMRALFGTALNNLGSLAYRDDEVWNEVMDEVGFTHGAETAGAEPRWIHPVSTRGGYDLNPINEPLSILSERIGMGANVNQIYRFTGDTGGAVNLQGNYNDTGVNFFTEALNYCKAHGLVFIYTVNVTHGTVDEMAAFIAEIIEADVEFRIVYDNEVSIGESGATPGTTLTSAQYVAKVAPFHDYIRANHPTVHTTINAALQNRSGWDGQDVADYAKANGINEVSQYMWQGDNAGNVPVANTSNNIDDYFQVALSNIRGSEISEDNPPGNNSLYGEIVPRLQTYYNLYYPVKFNAKQWGISQQRSGKIARTMLHGLGIWNQFFEFCKFNYTHNNFVASAVYVVNESTVDPKVGQDDLFSIASQWVYESEDGTFLKRIEGVALELLKPLSTFAESYPVFIPVTISNRPDMFSCICFVVGEEAYLWLYNYSDAAEISQIVIDGVTYNGTLDIDGAYSTKLYGSIGSSPTYNYFKDYPGDNPDLVPTDILPVAAIGASSSGVTVQQHSILRMKLEAVPLLTVHLNMD